MECQLFSVLPSCNSTSQFLKSLDSKEHVVVVVSYNNDIMGVVGYCGGDGSMFHAVSPD